MNMKKEQIIDEFVDLSFKLEDLSNEKDALRKEIIDIAKDIRQDNEKRLILDGEKHKVDVSFKEYIKLNTKSSAIVKIIEKFKSEVDNIFTYLFSYKRKATIVPEKLDDVLAVLKKHGLEEAILIEEEIVLDKKMYKQLEKSKVASKEEKELLDDCINKTEQVALTPIK